MNTRIILATLLTAIVFASPVLAEEKLTVEQIATKAYIVAYQQGKDGRARVDMKIVDSQGRERKRDMTVLRWDAPQPKQEEKKTQKDNKPGDNKPAKEDEQFVENQKFYVYFDAPADVKNMAFLVWTHLDRDDDRWLYLPKIDLVKRIAGSEKRTSFVGSDFFYEDISGRNVTYDTHELAETTNSYYVLKSTPKDPKTAEFSYYKSWIHRKTFLVIKMEYYDKNGKKYRQFDTKEVKQIQGYWTIMKSRMTDLQTNRYTDLTYSGVKYNLGIPEDIFSERYLRRPPMKYLEE